MLGKRHFEECWSLMAPRKEKDMRAQLEAKLFDLRYDMDLIGQEQELKEAIHNLSDAELLEAIEEMEE